MSVNGMITTRKTLRLYGMAQSIEELAEPAPACQQAESILNDLLTLLFCIIAERSVYAIISYHKPVICVTELTMVQEQGWLCEAERCPSPNYDARPEQVEIGLLVIHNISLPPGQFGGQCIRDFFCNQLDCDAHPYFAQLREMHVSAHLLIERDGNLLQFVSFEERAWHAGQSSYDDVPDCNNYSIGIELEGTDQAAYTDAQYTSLARVSVQLMQAYPAITPQRITGHSDIAPGRKTDPGAAFDWGQLLELIRGVQQKT